MVAKLANNASSTLASAINNSTTTVSIASGDASKFPALAAGEWFPLTVVDASGNIEVMRVTARSSATLTVVRGQEGTTARAFAAGSKCDLRLTAAAAVAPALATDATAVTQAAGDNSKALANTEFVQNAVGIAVPTGAVMGFARNSAPAGWLKANGAAVSRTAYAALFAAIGTTFGAGDGSTTFNLPDLRAEFVRGWDDSRGIDTGRVFGSWQDQMVGPHNHPTVASNSGFTGGLAAIQYAPGNNNGVSSVPGGGATFGVQNNAGIETRVRNVALLICIKF